MSETKINFFNKLKNTAINKFSSVPDITGQTIEDFYVEKRMEIPSGEADIYLCSGTENHAGKKFILKYYRRENAVKPEVIAKLRSISSPYVAPVSGFGEFQGHQYTIRPYYEFPALSDVLSAGTRFSENELKTYIIPSAIEGLKVVHDAGILHRDLKPGNLIPDDKGEHVVLIDFGISSNSDGVTFVMTQPGMTPFYAAPEAIQGIYHRETDYYALGITIFELFTGYTPFQNPDISGEEAAKLATISKIEFPDNFPENLRKLVLGLTYKDISHRNEKDNPNRRWGYDEVKRWLNGENVPVPGELTGTGGAESVTTISFQPYRFNGKTYTEEKELLLAMLHQPEDALKDLGRGILTHHYFILDEKKGTLCSSAENKIGKNSLENIIHLCTLIYDLRPDIKEITFNNRILNGLEVIGKNIIDNVIKEAVKTGNIQSSNSEIIKQVKEFALSGIPEEYASIILKNTGYAKIFTNVKKIWSEEQTIYSDTELALILGHSICNDRRIPVHGKVYASPEIFRKEMKHLAEKDRNAYTEFIQEAKADLNFLEKMLPDADSRHAITEALAEYTYAIFGDNEYFFKNGEDFENYVDKLVQEEKPYELQSLFYRYRTPLKDVSKKVWNTDSRTKLEKIVSGFIHIGEHLFTGEESCRKFLNEVQERGQKEPAYLLGFIKAHKESLDRAVKSFPGIKEAVTDLYSSEKKLVLFGEHLFNNSTEFATFIDSVITNGNDDPDYLVRFTEYHQQEISRLLSKDTNCQEVLNNLMNIRNRIVSFDEYTFNDVSDFNNFLSDLSSDDKNQTLRIANIAKEHHDSLIKLESNALVANQVKTLLKAENSKDKEKAIKVNGVKYTPITMKKGDIIKFGNYPQDNNGSKSPIEWLVLDVNENEALLISRYGLDCKQYHNVRSDITWEDCDLRKWLNNDFIKSAFSEEEAKKIKVSELKNENNLQYNTRGGNDTKDRIFCLSINEAEHYFGSDKDRLCKPTAYARKQGVYVGYDCCYWWLRSPGRNQSNAADVDAVGALDLGGYRAYDDNIAVRPALRIICNL